MAKKDKSKVVSDLHKGMVVEEMQLAIKGGGMVDYKNKPGQYLRLLCGDATGDVVVIVWDDKDPGEIWNHIEGNYDVVEVDGKVDEYDGVTQIIATDMFGVREYDPMKFLPKVKEDVNVDKMYEYIVKTSDRINNKAYRAIVKAFLEEYKEEFIFSTGAKAIHHAGIHGLILHIYEVLTFANQCCRLYNVNASLLRAGAILHDIGKMRTYTMNATIERNKKDYLLGHIFVGIKIIDKIIAKNNIPISEDDYDKLMHLMLNHHDIHSEEVVETLSPEAVALRKCDSMTCAISRVEKIKAENEDMDVYYDNIIKKQYYIGD